MRAAARWRDPALGQSHEVELRQGRLRYFDLGTGPILVFVHGAFVNANIWRKVVAQLAPEFRCVALDLPFGSHTLPMPKADLSVSGATNLVADAIEALDLEDVTLVGMDTGGAICQFLVVERPARIARLALCSCDYRDNFPPRIFTHLKLFPYLGPLVPLLYAPFRLRVVRRLPIGFGRLTTGLERKAEDSYALPFLEDSAIRADLARFLRIFDKRRLNQAADRLPSFDGPALIAWSAEDRVFPPEDARRLADDLPRSRLEWISDSRTFSMEEQPRQLADLLVAFIKEHELIRG